MASTMLDLPAPVGPLRANTSAPSKSTTARLRKDVKPSSSSRLGRMGVLQQLGEERLQSWVFDVLLFEIGGEQVLRGAASPRRAAASVIVVVERCGDHNVD